MCSTLCARRPPSWFELVQRLAERPDHLDGQVPAPRDRAPAGGERSGGSGGVQRGGRISTYCWKSAAKSSS